MAKEFKTRTEAKNIIKKALAPGKLNVKGDYRTRRTSPRSTITNYGFNNPRIVERMLYR